MDKECLSCHQGLMKKPFPVHSYDFTEDGKLPPYCTSCGKGYPEYIPVPQKLLTKISNGSIETILKTLCNSEKYFSYRFRDNLYRKLKDRSLGVYDLANEIVRLLLDSGYQIDWNYVIATVYSKLRFSS